MKCFQTDLQIIFGMLQYRKSKEGLKNYIQSNRGYFSNIDEDSYNAARVLLGSESSLREVTEKSGGIDLCKALDDLYQDGVNEGIEQGIERGLEQGIQAMILDYLEEGYDREKIQAKLQKRFSLSCEDSKQHIERVEKLLLSASLESTQ